MYIDKTLAVPTATLQNPAIPTPPELAKAMMMIEVMHYDFSGKIKKGQMIVHELVARDVQAFFKKAFMLRFPIHSVIPVSHFHWQDWASCAANNSSGHNMRNFEVEGKIKLSKHAIGCAFDINPMQNPCYELDEKHPLLQVKKVIPPDGRYDLTQPGTLQKGDALVTLMEKRGWAWGGGWKFPKDFQHFQIVPPELAAYVT